MHHSHMTVEITGYAHGFCNHRVREHKSNISVIAHNLFGFDFFFLLKEISVKEKAQHLQNNKSFYHRIKFN